MANEKIGEPEKNKKQRVFADGRISVCKGPFYTEWKRCKVSAARPNKPEPAEPLLSSEVKLNKKQQETNSKKQTKSNSR